MLAPVLTQAEQSQQTIKPKQAIVDQGLQGTQCYPENVAILVCERGKQTACFKRILECCNAIELVIGHIKLDHRTGLNYLMDQQGDQINTLLAGCGL
ncbi:MAG TPA: hypothetical protein V6D10_11405 [Trichocoleus sp.]|jgi:IS5 family transposase